MVKQRGSADTPFEKAGLFLYGRMKDTSGKERVHTVVSYTEGRLSNHEKCYGLAKGEIDPGETPIQAAVRETKEETGIDLEQMLGKKAYADFCAGKTIENLRCQGKYRGVTVLKADPKPIDHTYMSSHGNLHQSAYYAIELAGLEHLPTLKRLDPREGADRADVIIPAKQHAQSLRYPKFRERMLMLYTGISRSESGEKTTIIQKPHLPKVIEQHPLPLFRNNINVVENWVEYWKKLPDDARALLKQDLAKIKEFFEKRGMVGNSGEKLKFDTKMHPLAFYQEGAELLPVGVWLARSAKVAAGVQGIGDKPKPNLLHAKSMWGDNVKHPGVSQEDRMRQAQIAPAIEFFAKVAPEEIREAGKEEGVYNNRYLQRARQMVAKELKPENSETWQERVVHAPARIAAASARG